MKQKILTGSILLVIVALICIGRTPPVTGEDRLITVMNPAIATKFVERVPLGPRIDTVEGKTIFLVDMQWGGPEAAYSVFEEMKAWFAQKMPSVKIEIRRISGGPFANDDEALRKEIVAQKAGGVVIGIGG